MPSAEDQLSLLRQARDRALSLVDGIRKQRDELLTSRPATVTAEQLSEGRAAMDGALASAERMLAAVESALRLAQDNPGVMNPP